MIMLNTMSGMLRKPVQAKIITTVQLVVGGTDDEDRKDSVRELFDDHKEEIMASLSAFFKEGLVSTTIGDIEMLETEGKGDGDGK
jgi:hypothetical protein